MKKFVVVDILGMECSICLVGGKLERNALAWRACTGIGGSPEVENPKIGSTFHPSTLEKRSG
jgi:hypothetical protein